MGIRPKMALEARESIKAQQVFEIKQIWMPDTLQRAFGTVHILGTCRNIEFV